MNSMRTHVVCVLLAVLVSAKPRDKPRSKVTDIPRDEYYSWRSKVTTAPEIYNPENPYDRLPPLGIDPEFDCAWRKAAYAYATKLQRGDPRLDRVYNALQIGLCGGLKNTDLPNENVLSEPESQRNFENANKPLAATTLYVDAVSGSDQQSGGALDKPFKTVPFALNQSRARPGPVTIYLRGGTHRLSEPVLLTPSDSGLTIESYKGEQAWISGAVPLITKWKFYNGTKPNRNIWVTDLSGQPLVKTIPTLRVGGNRAQRARFPNAFLETSQFPDGWIREQITWLGPIAPPQPEVNIEIAEPNRGFMMDGFEKFELGVRGVCNNFQPPEGYWCSNHTNGGGAFTYRIPKGVTISNKLLPNLPYKMHRGTVLQAWHKYHWASWLFQVENGTADADGVTWTWTRGGFQDARGENEGNEWFVENVFEELDAANEYYFDESTKQLYYFHNASVGTPPPADLVFEAPIISTLIQVEGVPATRGAPRVPVKQLTLTRVGFRDTIPTYFEAHSMPSGGDWALQRMAVVFAEGTDGLTIQDCTFSRNDGVALMLSGYARSAIIRRNDFIWNGETAIALWGYTDLIDGTNGEQPRGTLIENNWCSEIGHFEKQSSCMFQAQTAQTTLRHNIFFNGPRALINFNDGFGGGNLVEENLLFNSCRESGDHGPFNSWDRQPYLTEVRDGTPSLIMATNLIRKNFMVANYGADGGCVDNDDGSSFYELIENFMIFGGHKSDFHGHNKKSFNNLNAYSNVYGERCAGIFGLPIADKDGSFNEGYINNTCVLPQATSFYLYISDECDPTQPAKFSMDVSGNRIYAPGGKALVHCGQDYDFDAWMGFKLDSKTSIGDVPPAKVIIQWAQQLLDF